MFTEISEVFILVPALLGLKGNLEMTLASRLSTAVSHLCLLAFLSSRITRLVLILWLFSVGLFFFFSVKSYPIPSPGNPETLDSHQGKLLTVVMGHIDIGGKPAVSDPTDSNIPLNLFLTGTFPPNLLSRSIHMG